MSIFTINRHRRFAMRNAVCLRAGNGEVHRGVMIEVSQEACRIAPHGASRFRVDDVVTVEIEGFGDFTGLIRSASDRSFAVRFMQPMPSAELQELVRSAGDASRPILHLPAFGV